MSLLEDWEAGSGYQDPGQGFTLVDDGLGLSPEALSPSQSVDKSIFGLQVAERQISKGKGQALAIAAAEGSITLVTSRANLIRYDLAQGSNPVLELELSRHADVIVRGLWVSGAHTIITLQLGNAYESHYIHANWKKSRVLSKLKDVKVSCIGWNKDAQSEGTTGDILVGSLAGILNEVVIDEKDKKEKVARRVFQLQDSKDPMTSVHQHTTPQGQRVVLMSTADRLYVFSGRGSLEAMFARYRSPDINNYIELGGGVSASPLQLYYQPGATQPEAFAWLTQPGVYYGNFNWDTTQHSRELDHLKNHRLLPYSSSRSDAPTLPMSVALSQYYLLLLLPSKVQCINRINGQVKQELAVPPSRALSAGPQTLALASDAAEGSLYLLSGDNLQEITVHEESRDMWRIYLDQQDYKNAFRHCKSQAERDAVNSAEAEACFGDGNFVEAARLLGKVTAAVPAFEEVVLRFVEVNSPPALQAFLQTKMDSLGHEDKAQATMVGTWLLELYLDQLNRSLLEIKGKGEPLPTDPESNGHGQRATGGAGGSSRALPAPHQLTKDLRAFLKRNVDVLDVNVTVSLLAGYGRLDDLMEYATYRKDWEAVVEYLMQRGEAERALPVLRRPGVSQELWYKFAPALMLLAPAQTVDAWMTAQPPLDPPRLLPALLRFAEDDAPQECQAHALRFLEFCIHHLENDDPAIHHLAAALYCLEEQEGPLLQYLAGARDLLGRPLYDPQTALRLARQRNKLQASVQLLCDLNLYEDAVLLALSFDMSLASATANRPEDEPALKRSLWLTIARHIVQQHPSQDQEVAIKQVNEFLRESGGVIKIEDVLPLFPDFVKIDAFKEAICQSLEDYNKQIDQLKSEMEDATQIADALRKDMAALEHRAATLDLSEGCARCGVAVGEPPPATAGISGGCVPPFYLFPSGNAFHGACLAHEVMQLVPPPQQQRIHTLLTTLSQLSALRSHAIPQAEEPAAWHSIAQELLSHTHQPESMPEQRPLFEEFLSRFPTAALHWKAYAELAMAVNSPEVRSIFSRSLLSCPSVDLWSTYLTFIKRVNQSKGEAGMLETRKAYEYALDRIGLDLHSAGLWQEYIKYLQMPRPNTPAYRALWSSNAAPGQEEAQRVMTLRGAYQRALQVPCLGLDQLWRAYEVFEQQGSSRALARRVLEQQRPRYQAARTALGPRTRHQEALNLTALPFSPGAAGYEQQQLAAAWRAYLAWECGNPQKLTPPELAARVSLAYDQALMPLRFYPDVWLEHADWREHSEGGSPHLALQVLKKARQVLPGCLLLHFAAADLQEGEGNIEAARQVYQELLPSLNPDEPLAAPPPQMTPEMVTCTWLQCLCFVRRAQSLKDARQTFLKASKVPDIGWQVFVASALMEWHHDNSNVKVPKNIWELGAKRFMAEPGFVLAYIDFQLGLGDTANCRATFERSLTVTPPPQAKPLWDQYLRFESQHGSPEAVSKVEQRRREALNPVSPTDQLHSLLLKHQQGDLWPLQPAEQDHCKRLLGLAPPLPEPVVLGPPAPPPPHHFGGAPGGPQTGRPVQPGASPLMDNWSPAATQHASPMHNGPGPGPLPAAPGPHANGPGVLTGAPTQGAGPGPLQQPPALRGPPQPLTQFPIELGNFINKLPPARTLEGAHPNVDQVIDILMSADLFAGDPYMEGNDMAGPAGGGPARWPPAGPDGPFQGQPMHQQVGPGRQPDMSDLNGQQGILDIPGQKRKQPDNGFGGALDGQEANGFASSPTIRNAPPAHDVFRMRQKQRTKMAEG